MLHPNARLLCNILPSRDKAVASVLVDGCLIVLDC